MITSQQVSVTWDLAAGINLTQANNKELVGKNHAVTATLTDQFGDPAANVLVSFQVLSGPNKGAEAAGTYNPANRLSGANGQVQFTYTSNGNTGTDVIAAMFTDDFGRLITSTQLSVTWSYAIGINIAQTYNKELVGASHTVVATLTNQVGALASNVLVSFQVLSGPNKRAEATGTYNPANRLSGANGQVQFTYTSNGNTGTDVIAATFTDDFGRLITSTQLSVTWSYAVGVNIAQTYNKELVGASHTVVATLTNQVGALASNVLVSFQVLSGPNKRAEATGAYNPANRLSGANGQVQFTYTSNGNTGTDVIAATFTDDFGRLITSTQLSVTWSYAVGINLTQAANKEWACSNHTVVARLADQIGNSVCNLLVSFQVLAGPNAGAETSGTYGPTSRLSDSNGQLKFTYTSNGKTGTDVIVARFTDIYGKVINSQQLSVTWSLAIPNVVAVGNDAGGGNLPWVKVYNTNGVLQTQFLAYENTFVGGVCVAVGDVTGDGTPDIITVPKAGRAPEVRVFQGSVNAAGQYSAKQSTCFNATVATFRGGLSVAVGDVNGDGRNDIIVGEGPGAMPQVFVFDGNTLTSTHSMIGSAFYGVENTFRGGVTVAASDLDNNGRAEVIVARGPGGPPTVNVFSYSSATRAFILNKSFLAFASTFTGGVSVAAGDFDGDGANDIICGAGAGWLPMVNVYSGKNLPKRRFARPAEHFSSL